MGTPLSCRIFLELVCVRGGGRNPVVSSPDNDIVSLIEVARRHWPEPLGLVIALVISTHLWTVVANTLEISGIWSGILLVLVCSAIWITWYRSRRVPTATKGLVSIAVAIAAPDEKLQKKITPDFVADFRAQLSLTQ